MNTAGSAKTSETITESELMESNFKGTGRTLNDKIIEATETIAQVIDRLFHGLSKSDRESSVAHNWGLIPRQAQKTIEETESKNSAKDVTLVIDHYFIAIKIRLTTIGIHPHYIGPLTIQLF